MDETKPTCEPCCCSGLLAIGALLEHIRLQNNAILELHKPDLSIIFTPPPQGKEAIHG